MKKPLLLFFALLISSHALYAAGSDDDLRKRAEENPLDCALYLLKHDKENIDREKLAEAFFQVKRYDDTLRVIDFDKDSNNNFTLYARYAVQLAKKGDRANSEKFISKGLEMLQEDHWYRWAIPDLVDALILTGHFKEVESIVAAKIDNADEEDIDEDRLRFLYTTASALIKAGRSDTALVYLQKAYERRATLDYFIDRARIAGLFARLSHPDEAFTIIRELQETADNADDPQRRYQILGAIISLYIEMGEREKAMALWQSSKDPYLASYIISGPNVPLDVNEIRPFLPILESDVKENGRGLTAFYLKLGDTENAIRIAKAISTEDDSYYQQEALMLVADKFIESGKTDAALNILNLASRKARNVGEEHNQEDSNGASPLTRKIIYLRNIQSRYLKLKRYDLVSASLKTVKSENIFAKEFVSESLIELAAAQSKTLPRKEINDLIAQTKRVFDKNPDPNSEECLSSIRVIKLYLDIGDTTDALELFTRTLDKINKDGNYYLDDFLIAVGTIFEEKHVKATPDVKAILGDLIGDEDETEK